MRHFEDVTQTSLDGLQGLEYQGNTADSGMQRDLDESLRFSTALDRLYGKVAAPLRLHDGPDHLLIGQRGFADVVVWNPGAEGSARIDDLDIDEARRFICVEAAQVIEPVELAAGARWRAAQRLQAE